MPSLKISVVVPTYNPNISVLHRVIQAINSQTLDSGIWELIIIDNASSTPLSHHLFSEKILNLRIIREDQLGLTSARCRGVQESQGDFICFVDDDNVIAPSYLKNLFRLFTDNPKLGVVGGKSIAEYQTPPPSWFSFDMAPIGCRDLGQEMLVYKNHHFKQKPSYPWFSPIGAGMAFRKTAVSNWMKTALNSNITDRRGSSLSSAGDCDIVLYILENGWDIAYSPDLYLDHIISPERLSSSYLQKISRTAYRDFIRVLDAHGIRPWSKIPAWSVPLRSFKAWLTCRAWRGPEARLKWQSAIGQFEGRSAISTN